jgi:ferredoxin
MARKPFVDQEVCIGCGLCAQAVPEVFRMNDDNLAEVHDPFGAPEQTIQEAMDGCPVACIHWE